MDSTQENKIYKFGLLGRNISYSFSRGYFTSKFDTEELDCEYVNFDIDDINKFRKIIQNEPNLKGLNVTIPYKESILPYLDSVHKKAKAIGAVNTIKITKKRKLKGYNTDCYGFEKSIKPHLKKHHKSALILGTGGASKAIAYTLEKLKIHYDYVSRSESKAKYTYSTLDESILEAYKIIINCTPIGTYPNVNECPAIPYDGISEKHLLYDLIYNPEQTKFLRLGELQGATIVNGLPMLKLQAEKSWKIWNKR